MISRVSNQNGISQQWYIVKIHHSGREPSICICLTHLHVFLILHTIVMLLFVGCLTSQQHASVSQGRICSDSFTCCHTEIQVADPTLHLTQSQYTGTWPTSPSTDPLTPGACRVATGVPISKSLVWLNPGKIPPQAGFEPRIFRSRGRRLNH